MAGSGCATPWVFGGGFENEFMRGNRFIAPQLWKRCARLIPPRQAAPDVDEVGSHWTAHVDELAVELDHHDALYRRVPEHLQRASFHPPQRSRRPAGSAIAPRAIRPE